MSVHRTTGNTLIVLASAALLGVLVFFLVRDGGKGEPLAAPGNESTPVTGPYDRAVKIRTDNGLRHDFEWVVSVENDPDAIRTWFGIAMTPAELADLEARNAALLPAANVARALVEDLPGFGGLYLRRAPSDAVVVIDSGSNGRIASALAGFEAATVVIQKGQYTLQYLNDLTARISGDADQLRSEGIEIVSIGPSVESNRVEVSVHNLSKQQAERLRAEYGTAALVVEGAPFIALE